MKQIMTILSVLFILTGCATTYQKNSLTGGYSETQLDENLFNVTFKGNGYTSKERANDFTLLRCAELTIENGYKFFTIVTAQDNTQTRTRTSPITTKTEASVSGSGNSASGTSTTRTYGGQTYTITKPSTSNTILCYRTKPNTGFSYNAEFIYRSITNKYGIN